MVAFGQRLIAGGSAVSRSASARWRASASTVRSARIGSSALSGAVALEHRLAARAAQLGRLGRCLARASDAASVALGFDLDQL